MFWIKIEMIEESLKQFSLPEKVDGSLVIPPLEQSLAFKLHQFVFPRSYQKSYNLPRGFS